MQISQQLFDEANKYIPGGVNSPVRAFHGVGGTPIFIKSASGAYVIDVDDKKYIDYVGSWGPMILGHNHPDILTSIGKQLIAGISYGAPTKLEIEMAQTINKLMPAIEKVRMVNSGTEATMSAIRLARGFTGRDKIIKFEGCYHGHSDSLLVKAGSGALTLGVPSSPGVPESLALHTIILPYNNTELLLKTMQDIGHDVACIIVEPIAGNMNCVIPDVEFLEAIRKSCNENDSVLIFDEVMTGFRVALGGASEYFGITPDLITLGKVIGGGLPVGAFGGKSYIMDHIAPQGKVYQAGTLSGNPLAMVAGMETLRLIQAPGFYDKLNNWTSSLLAAIQNEANKLNIKFTTTYAGGMFGIYFTDKKHIRTFADVSSNNLEHFKLFFHKMLDSGIYMAPSAYEAGFTSSAHTGKEFEVTVRAANRAFTILQSSF